MPQLFIPSVHSQLLFPAMKEEELCPSPSYSNLGDFQLRDDISEQRPPSSLPWAAQGASKCYWDFSEYLVAVGQGRAGPVRAALMEQVQLEAHGESSKDAVVKDWAELSRKEAVFC